MIKKMNLCWSITGVYYDAYIIRIVRGEAAAPAVICGIQFRLILPIASFSQLSQHVVELISFLLSTRQNGGRSISSVRLP